MNRQIYLDYHATTPCDPRVVDAMLPYFTTEFGNPSSGLHQYGRCAAEAVEIAREQVAALIGAAPQELVFTSGATESNNIVIHGAARAASSRKRIVISAIEHKAVLEPAKSLADSGFDVVVLPATRHGVVDLDAAEAAINDQTLLVSVQTANNEIGTIQPLTELAMMARQRGAMIHTDAAQAVGKVPFHVDDLGVDFASVSGHKLYGPKGVGALFVSHRVRRRLVPVFHGGGQESDLRPGTLNVPGIVGLGESCRLAMVQMDHDAGMIASLRDILEERLMSSIPGLVVNGRSSPRLPGASSISFPGVDADALILNVPELALSTGSACTFGALEPSHVLTALGVARVDANSTIRIGVGRYTTSSEIDTTTDLLTRAWKRLAFLSKSHSP